MQRKNKMKSETLIRKLIEEGTIERIRVNRYRVNSSYRTRGLGLSPVAEATTSQVCNWFAVDTGNGWQFKSWGTCCWAPDAAPASTQVCTHTVTLRYMDGRVDRRNVVDGELFVLPVLTEGNWERRTVYGHTAASRQYNVTNDLDFRQHVQLRTITRERYHSNGNGIGRTGIDRALGSIAVDADGVRRSYGLEWEINRLTEVQEDKLARLLDTLPAHFTERDGSLCDSGVEIIFLPMSKDVYIDTWTKLKTFCVDNHIDMEGTGAHTTFGVNNSEIRDEDDLQIRLNRAALAIKASSTQSAIKRLFGRDFTGYARLPNSTTHREHSIAISASRGRAAFELRLCNWQADVVKLVEFLEKIEFVFHRTFTAQDFINIFTLMGSDCTGM